MNHFALITGGSRGIGLAIAHYLAAKGMNLILLAKHIHGLEQARNEILSLYPHCTIKLLPLDMSDPIEVDLEITRLVNKNLPIDILVNSAGILKLGAVELSAKQICSLLTINLTSTLIITNRIAEHMKVAGRGHIFTLASRAGVENLPQLATYACSKAALISYSEALYKGLMHFNVKVTCLCPSVVNTDMTNDGRIDNARKIQVADIVAAVAFVLGQGNNAQVPRLDIHSREMELLKS
ncbi:SDR family NAD(P)-dependent oxidoreductase [Enterobacter mori]